MVIHKAELFLKQAEGDKLVFKKEVECVGVDLNAVLGEADRLIAHWLKSGYAAEDYLAMVTSGESYRPESGAIALAPVVHDAEPVSDWSAPDDRPRTTLADVLGVWKQTVTEGRCLQKL